LITKEEIAKILIPFDSDKPDIRIMEPNGISRTYTIDLLDTHIFKTSNVIEVEKIKGD